MKEECIPSSGSSQLFFSAWIQKGEYVIRIAAETLYRLRINGEVTAYGPARAPHGYARIDRIPSALESDSTLELEVVHYEVKSFYMPLGPGFVLVEISRPDGSVILETCDFSLRTTGHRDFNVEKFTHQRHLLESYDYTRTFEYKAERDTSGIMPKFLDRGAPLCDLNRIYTASRTNESRFPCFDFGRVVTGFIRCTLSAKTECELILGFDELNNGEFPGGRAWWGHYHIHLKLNAGQHLEFESFEAYTLRYLGIQVVSGEFSVESVSLREYAFPEKLIKIPNAVHNSKIGRAAVETFRQNTVDTFMDCPCRERAAWLCDSFFTARTSFLLTGNTELEETFLENFLIPDAFDGLPHGMFPMCYPADTRNYIPQWGLWLILQIDDYLKKRKGKRDFPHEFKDRFTAFLDFFKPYCNEDGLIENLPGWNFVDCSRANDFVDGVNYPTNLLYAQVLEIVSGWYGRPELFEKADGIRAAVHRKGVAHGRLHDNDSMRSSSEAAQYYALLFGGVHFKDISAFRADSTDAPCGLLMGKFLRFEILLREKNINQLKSELEETFGNMADTTGTLWEKNRTVPFRDHTSCCHGFSSYVAVLINSLQPLQNNSPKEVQFISVR